MKEEKKEQKKDTGTVENYSIYPISIAVFKSDSKGTSVRIQKTYKDRETGELENTTSFNLSDLATILELAKIALNDQTAKRSKEY